ncbi:MAG: HAD-IA family hydrolase, partial [Verrucomicrobiae bacterium]|nr:HAD-IA family hydrolase [Verrucomicrobiae bacterium]
IFDFDGTLANTIETGLEIFNEIAAQYRLRTVSREEAQQLRHLNTRALLDRLGISRLMAVKLVAHIRRLIHDRMDSVDMIPGTAEAVTRLGESGFPMGILSSNAADNVRQFLQRHGIAGCFSFVEAGVSLFGKPQRIKNVLRRQNCDARRAMYIGDETRDMEAARRAGVSAIAVCWGANERESMLTEDPEFCVQTPEEMVAAAVAFSEKIKTA